MRLAILPLLCGLALSALAVNQFEAGMAAFEAQDYGAALAAFQPLAEAGDPDAQYMLGRLYARGNGVIQDFILAHLWFNVAAANDHRQASAAREAVAARMTPEQVAAAQQAARRFASGDFLPDDSGEQIPPQVIRLSPEQPLPEPPPLADQATVARIQLALSQRGYDIGPITGEVDEVLTEAILDYQLTNFLAVDGHPSEALLARLLGETGNTPAIARGANAPVEAGEPEWIWRRILLEDAFRDGDYERNPTWVVDSGRFWVEPGRGLRSVLEPNGEVSQAGIHVERSINNAFAIELALVSRENSGRLEFGPYQDNPGTGYRLIYYPAHATGFELRLASPTGNAVIARSQRRFDLESGGVHELVWTRDDKGQMSVSLNGNVLLEALDRSFREPFDGFALVNHGGDYNLRRLSIKGGN